MYLSRLKTIWWNEYLPMLLFAYFNTMLSQMVLIWPVLLYLCFKWKGWIFVCIGYYLWTRYDSVTLKTEGRKINWLTHSRIFDCICGYFPIRLIKTSDLVPGNNYIFGCFPHGVVPWGVIYTFFSHKLTSLHYPGFDFRGNILAAIFSFPISREYFMGLGFCTPEEDNIKYLLNKKTSTVTVMCPGGAKEMFFSQPGSKYIIVKKNRKGFVRIALQSGCPLVPVFIFGANNNLKQRSFNFPLWNYISDKCYKLARLKLVWVTGKEFFSLGFNCMPHRRPITTVGAPIEVPKVEKPSNALIDEYHEKFYQALGELFENNKRMYDEAGENAKLEMI